MHATIYSMYQAVLYTRIFVVSSHVLYFNMGAKQNVELWVKAIPFRRDITPFCWVGVF